VNFDFEVHAAQNPAYRLARYFFILLIAALAASLVFFYATVSGTALQAYNPSKPVVSFRAVRLHKRSLRAIWRWAVCRAKLVGLL